MTPELMLLLSCARVIRSDEDDAAIGQMLDDGIDWSAFARKAVDHGLAGLVGHTLATVAPDGVPYDILTAFQMNVDQTRKRNCGLFDGLAEMMDALTKRGVEAIPFKGPVLALEAYGDLGLRVFQDLDFLVRDSDVRPTMVTMRELGYERQDQLTKEQIAVIQRLQGQDFLYNKTAGIGVEPHTRLTPNRMALDIDYPGLWHRARRTILNAHTMLTLEPEDHFLILAIHGGKELWWNIKWACDIAAFVGSHPGLDWLRIIERARAQGCLRMVLLSMSLARKYLNAAMPEAIAAAENADTNLEPMSQRILTHWLAEEAGGPPSNNRVSMDRMRLHDGILRRGRYMARTCLLPGRQHVASIALPHRLSFAYAPFKVVHDLAMLPLWRVYRNVLSQAQRLSAVLTNSDPVLAMMPGSSEAKQRINRYKEARVNAKRALADPNNVTAWHDLGNAQLDLKRYKEAIASYDKGLALEPEKKSLWTSRLTAMQGAQNKVVLPPWREAVPSNPQNTAEWTIRAGAFQILDRFAEAVEASDRALALDSSNIAAARVGIQCRLFACDWRRREDDKKRISAELKTGTGIIVPLNHRAICDSEEEFLTLARNWSRPFQPSTKSLWRGEPYGHAKIRIAYISTDLCTHPVGSAIVGCLEHHDKARFETCAISLGPDDESEVRQRIKSAVDCFIDARKLNDATIATKLRELEIDIAIDLNGYTGAKRTGIFGHRSVPVQVNYLGFPGTMGAQFIDYIVADRMVIPCKHQLYYSEKVVYLPHTFLPYDGRRQIAEIPSRTDAGLPQVGFVFTSLNSRYKIGPEIFDVWMRLLRDVEGSVLWLSADSESAIVNLWREARTRDIAPERIVFAPRVPRSEDYLARLRMADLFLDTLPYNAHTRTSDALWAGLPVVTCAGSAFPGRVAASLLHAIGMPELVTSSLTEYEELARSLARDPERLAAIKAKLLRNRDIEPLFDTARFTRDLESAYATMWERQETGLPPAAFAVAT